MLVPGSNLLSMALTALGRQTFQYFPNTGRTTNAIGQDVAEYGAPYLLQGSVQPLERKLYEQYGLDLQRNYINVYVSQSVVDVARDVSGDQIVFNGATYQCLSRTPWHGVDGWDAVLCVQVP